jgi:hypothetical protein
MYIPGFVRTDSGNWRFLILDESYVWVIVEWVVGLLGPPLEDSQLDFTKGRISREEKDRIRVIVD